MATNNKAVPTDDCGTSPIGTHGIVTEAWSEGFVVGALVIMIFVTVANMKRKIWLHKLILIELVMALLHGTFIFMPASAFGWYTSSTATLLYVSYNLHNFINWVKIKPFLSKWGSIFYVGTILLVLPYWVAETYLNFSYNNDLGSDYFRHTRPWEALCRDPWWIFTSFYLIYVVKHGYGFGVLKLMQSNARFGILIASILLSIGFIVADAIDVATNSRTCAGKNPYWKLAFVFKCSADTILLDDFKSVLDRLTARNLQSFGGTDIESAPGGSRLSGVLSLKGVNPDAAHPTATGNQEGRWSLPRQHSQGAVTNDGTSAGQIVPEFGHVNGKPPVDSLGHKEGRAEHIESSDTAQIQRNSGRRETKNWFDIYDTT